MLTSDGASLNLNQATFSRGGNAVGSSSTSATAKQHARVGVVFSGPSRHDASNLMGSSWCRHDLPRVHHFTTKPVQRHASHKAQAIALDDRLGSFADSTVTVSIRPLLGLKRT